MPHSFLGSSLLPSSASTADSRSSPAVMAPCISAPWIAVLTSSVDLPVLLARHSARNCSLSSSEVPPLPRAYLDDAAALDLASSIHSPTTLGSEVILASSGVLASKSLPAASAPAALAFSLAASVGDKEEEEEEMTHLFLYTLPANLYVVFSPFSTLEPAGHLSIAS